MKATNLIGLIYVVNYPYSASHSVLTHNSEDNSLTIVTFNNYYYLLMNFNGSYFYWFLSFVKICKVKVRMTKQILNNEKSALSTKIG